MAGKLDTGGGDCCVGLLVGNWCARVRHTSLQEDNFGGILLIGPRDLRICLYKYSRL